MLVGFVVTAFEVPFQSQSAPAGSTSRFADPVVTLRPADCAVARLGDAIPASDIGEPVSSVTLLEPRWIPATDALPARCEVDGRIAPVDTSPTARPINFRVWLPAEWNRRAVQQGGGGMNGVIPDLRGAPYPIDGRSPAQWGFVTYGSDSGHQSSFGQRGGRGEPATGAAASRGGGATGPAAEDWALNDEAIATSATCS